MLRRLRALFRRDVIADEIRDEYEFHLEMRIEERMRQGWSRAEAERLVRKKFGNVAKWRDAGYDERGGGVIETVVQDVRQSVRLMRRKPTFATATIATLALGMGLLATLSAIVDAAWLRPLPFVAPDRLVQVEVHLQSSDYGDFQMDPSVLDVAVLRSTAPVLTAIGSYRGLEQPVTFDDGAPQRVRSMSATDGYFEALGAVPVVGRSFNADDLQEGAETVVILGYGFWRQRFAESPDVVGTRVNIDNRPATVVGVAPRDFHRSIYVWRPTPAHGPEAARRGWTTVVAQLRAGVSLDEAEGALSEAARHLTVDPHLGPVRGVSVSPVYAELVEGTRDAVWLVAAGIGVLMLLVGVNVSGLVHAEGASRRQELAVRAALGAGRGRLVRHQMTAASVLALVAAGVGLLVAAWSLPGLLAILPVEFPPHVDPAINLRTMFATLVVGVVASWLVTLVPAWRLSAMNLREWIEGRLPDVRTGRFRRPGQVLVAAQVALAVVLLFGGGVLLRSVDQLLAVDLGFDPHAVHMLEVTPVDPAPVVWANYYPALVDRLREVRGVEAAGASDWVPLARFHMFLAVSADGPDLSPAGVSPGFLDALGVRVRHGRVFERGDVGQPVAVLTESAAREVFASTDVVGRTVDVSTPHTVIGVVSDVRGFGPRSAPQNVVFVPLIPSAFSPPSVFLRLSASGPSLPELRAVASSLGPRVVVERLRPGSTLLDENVQVPRQRSALLSTLAAFGLALTLIGIGGVTTQAVIRRTREIGLRMACGATPGQVVRTVAADTLKPALLGLVIGFGASFYFGGILERYLFKVTLTDPVTMVAVGAVVVVSATVVAWIPARHAARVDPVQALRQ